MQENVTVIQLTEEKLRQLLSQSAQVGARHALMWAGLPIKEYFTRSEMQRRHGRRLIDELIRAHKLTPHKLPETDEFPHKRIVYSETELLSLII